MSLIQMGLFDEMLAHTLASEVSHTASVCSRSVSVSESIPASASVCW